MDFRHFKLNRELVTECLLVLRAANEIIVAEKVVLDFRTVPGPIFALDSRRDGNRKRYLSAAQDWRGQTFLRRLRGYLRLGVGRVGDFAGTYLLDFDARLFAASTTD